MKFLDEAKVYVKGGDGGDGVVAFRRERFIEYGGPDGGNGGRGGHVYARAVDGLNTLIDYRYAQHFKARKGGNGAGADRTGAASDDVILKVPVGTQILAEDRETLVAAGDCVHQRPGIVHYLFDYSPDMEYLEVVGPADFNTVDVEGPCAVPTPAPWR